MKPRGTILALLCLLTAAAAQAQAISDHIWARDVAGAEITFDGALDEAVWQQATAIPIKWDNEQWYTPGGGWDNFFGNLSAGRSPEDPVDATAYVLRDGNILWIGIEASDKSIGANSSDFWLWDGLAMSITNKNRRPEQPETTENLWTGTSTDEFFFSWHDRYNPGDMPRLFGNNGDDREMWDARAAVDGTTNDDTSEDVGYTMEVWIDVTKLGFDFTSDGGDRLPMTFGLWDNDYTGDAARTFQGRAWWQSPWGGDMPYAVGYVHGAPGVTVDSGAAPELSSTDLRIGTSQSVVTVDGELSEVIWGQIEPQIALQYQMTAEELDALPGFGPYYTSWYRPGGGETAPPVVDASTARLHMFFQGTTLYIGLDSDDQAISGDPGEDRNDGLRVILRTLERDTLGLPYKSVQFRVAIDSTGGLRLLEGAADNPAVQAAVHLKGASTAADPSDIDEGYQIEMAIDLSSLAGYEGGLGDGIVRLAAVYFDGDYLDPEDQSTWTRVWFLAERAGQGPGLVLHLDPTYVVSTEQAPGELPSTIVLLGNYPNPFNPATRIGYVLPQAGEVTVEVFDLLGRRVAQLAPGLQPAGRNDVRFDASGLASGLYLYRVQLDGAHRLSTTGRMMLLK